MHHAEGPRVPRAGDVAVLDAATGGPSPTVELWDRMSVSSAAAAPRRSRAVSPGLAGALALIDQGFGITERPGAAGGRAVPSAGALHPYECYVITAVRESAPVVFHTDAVRRRGCRVPTPDAAVELLRRADISAPRGGEALVVIVTRPWLSMRKYGDRGYLYTHLDTAHFAVNLLGLATAGGGAELRLRFGREPIAELLGVRGGCREVHSILRIESADRGDVPGGWTLHDAVPGAAMTAVGPERPTWLELACWRSLDPLQAEDVPAAVTSGGRTLLPDGGRFPLDGALDVAGRWWELSRERRSSKAFRPGAIAADTLGRALSATGTRLPVDLPDTPDLGVTLVARSVTGLEPGVYRTVRNGPAAELSEPAAPAPTDDDVVQACMQQEHLGPAAAVVLFHTRRDALVGRSPAAMRELLFRAGALGQLLYLGATGARLGVTGVGGFDTRRWRDLGCVRDRDELLYVVLFGRDGGPGTKWDREQTAYAQRGR